VLDRTVNSPASIREGKRPAKATPLPPIGLDKLLQSREQRRMGETFAFDPREDRLRKGFRDIGEGRPALVFSAIEFDIGGDAEVMMEMTLTGKSR